MATAYWNIISHHQPEPPKKIKYELGKFYTSIKNLPSPMASVISSVRLFIRSTIPAFCKGATRQHSTTLQEIARSKSCWTEKGNQYLFSVKSYL